MTSNNNNEHERQDAMMEFLSCFPTVSGPTPDSFQELSDGVVMFEALSHIAPDHFDASTIARDTGSNWALKSSNLRKLLRNLEIYYHDVLHKDYADFESLSSNSISTMARNQNVHDISTIIGLIAAAAVTCADRAEYVSWIMNMTPANQIHMKGILESYLTQLDDFQDESIDRDAENIQDDFLNDDDDDDDFEGGAEMTGLFRSAMQDMDKATLGMDDSISFSGTNSNNNNNNNNNMKEILRERDELKQSLAVLKRELATSKSQSALLAEDTETSHKKLRVLAQDLQDRLEKRQTELSTAEEELLKTKRMLEDSKSLVLEYEEKNKILADELDVANAKAAQLRKAESTVVAYRKKLEGVGVMNQQMTDLEDQAAGYLRQIMDLEVETKKVPELQKNLEEVRRELTKVEKEKVEFKQNYENKSAEVVKLKADLSASNRAKKLYEDELSEMRVLQSTGSADSDAISPSMAAMSLSNVQTAVDKEKIMRLEIENNNLRAQLGISNDATVGASTMSSSSSHETEINRLKEELVKKEVETAKIASDKDKLEAYTKKTLARFQEKYLVALQECKIKLKEKHDKIEQLELRSAAEKSSQKREEKLLMSTIYELGLSIMQQKLKER